MAPWLCFETGGKVAEGTSVRLSCIAFAQNPTQSCRFLHWHPGVPDVSTKGSWAEGFAQPVAQNKVDNAD